MLLIVSSSATVYIQSQIVTIVEKLTILGPLAGLILFFIKFLPYCVLWIVFSFIYIVMPNTKVNFSSGVFAGVVAGTIYQLVQWVYITFQIGASKAGAIYGSFAALPLFLVWLQLSWRIVLLGSEFSFAHQNVDTYEMEPDCNDVSPSFKRLLSLRIVQLVVKRFAQAEVALDADQIAHELEMPIRLVNELIYELINAEILIEVESGEEKTHAYQPAQDPDNFTLSFVIESLEKKGTESLPIEQTVEVEKLQASLIKIRDMVRKMPENMLLKNM